MHLKETYTALKNKFTDTTTADQYSRWPGEIKEVSKNGTKIKITMNTQEQEPAHFQLQIPDNPHEASPEKWLQMKLIETPQPCRFCARDRTHLYNTNTIKIGWKTERPELCKYCANDIIEAAQELVQN